MDDVVSFAGNVKVVPFTVSLPNQIYIDLDFYAAKNAVTVNDVMVLLAVEFLASESKTDTSFVRHTQYLRQEGQKRGIVEKFK